MLRVWRPVAIDLAQAKTARERRVLLDQFASNAPDFAHYAAAAWIARTLALTEYLEGFEPDIPRQWAGAHAFSLMNDFEGDETWLWPFDSESPWPDEGD